MSMPIPITISVRVVDIKSMLDFDLSSIYEFVLLSFVWDQTVKVTFQTFEAGYIISGPVFWFGVNFVNHDYKEWVIIHQILTLDLISIFEIRVVLD